MMIDASKLRSYAMVLSLTASSALVHGADNGLTPAAAAELLYQLESLQMEVSQLRGKIEEQSHELNKMKRNQLDRYIDLDKRLTTLLNKPAAAPVVASPLSVPAVSASPSTAGSSIVSAPIQVEKPTAEVQAAYRSAYDLVRNKSYVVADQAFTDFVVKYPRNELTGNAYYWLGELKLVQNDKAQALKNFEIVSTRFSGHTKEADALYKSGIVYDQLNQKEKARALLSQVIDGFPETNTAKLAAGYLSNIK
jgi:tol-pal system protein YbgF